MRHYVIGADFGSDSVRALIVNGKTGEEIAEASCFYPRWMEGKYQNPERNMFRQHPLDYIEAMTNCVRAALDKAGEGARTEIAAISVDTTGSTPCPVDANGTPLALLSEFSENPNAMFHLWKDHTAIAEAIEITNAFRNNADGIDYTRYQGNYSSEWFWAKILHTMRLDRAVADAAHSWVEHSDWIPSLLANQTKPEEMYRCACAAGHKAYWHSAWNGLPSRRCLTDIDACLAKVVDTYGRGPEISTKAIGRLCPEWAERFGLDTDVIVGGSSFDAHAGAVGAGVRAGTMVLNLGTSAVNMLVAPAEQLNSKAIAHLGGAAENSIIPGLVGFETAQAAFGDSYAWLRRLLVEPTAAIVSESDVLNAEDQKKLIEELEDKMLSRLQRDAEKLKPAHVPVALDWFNARRYPCPNESARSAIQNLTLGTGAAEIYLSIILATAFGQKRILDALAAEGISPERIVCVGGIAQKSTLVMQTLANVLGRRIDVSKTRQGCALGAAIYAAVAAGFYGSVEEAQNTLCEDILCSYEPDASMEAEYAEAYARYLKLSQYMDPTMKV